MRLSTQRPAIEELAPHLHPLMIERGQRYFLDGREIFFCGISAGLNVNAALYGIPFAGFVLSPRDGVGLPGITQYCAGAVLIRRPRDDEEARVCDPCDGQPPRRNLVIVEALEWKLWPVGGGSIVVFRRNGNRVGYVDLI